METLHRIAPNLVTLAVPIGQLIPFPGNARVHADATLAESLQTNQQYRPVVVQKSTNYILAGNGTWKAAVTLGWTHLAATFIDVDDNAARRIVLVDNRASDIATYDNAALLELLKGIEDPVGTGYDQAALTTLLGQLDPVPVPDGKPVGPAVDVGGSVQILQCDARKLPLTDKSVDLIVTSPPFYSLRSYQDDGKHYDGQVGAEQTPDEYLEALWECTREWMRLLKPTGSLWVNLGDKYSGGSHNDDALAEWSQDNARGGAHKVKPGRTSGKASVAGFKSKSLLGLPWRYAIGCIDRLGLILRAEVVWSKPNGLPESVVDRVRRSHEQWFHFTVRPTYYSAVDEIRETYGSDTASRYVAGRAGTTQSGRYQGYAPGNRLRGDGTLDQWRGNALGKLPGSVWEVATQPLVVPAGLPDHFAAFPIELPRRIILGWSSPGICTKCGEGRRPVAVTSLGVKERLTPAHGEHYAGTGTATSTLGSRGPSAVITGHVCACTPYTDHPERRSVSTHGGMKPPTVSADKSTNQGINHNVAAALRSEARTLTGPIREYHFDQWEPPDTTPAVVLDPFGGTGTTALVASVLGRTGITNDLSHDYCEIARWRTADVGERAKVLRRMEGHDDADEPDVES